MIIVAIILLVAGIILFLIGLLQIDTLFWDSLERGVDIPFAEHVLWIPEFHVTWKNAFILMWLVTFSGFLLIVSDVIYLIWLLVG